MATHKKASILLAHVLHTGASSLLAPSSSSLDTIRCLLLVWVMGSTWCCAAQGLRRAVMEVAHARQSTMRRALPGRGSAAGTIVHYRIISFSTGPGIAAMQTYLMKDLSPQVFQWKIMCVSLGFGNIGDQPN